MSLRMQERSQSTASGKHSFYVNERLAAHFYEVSSPAEQTETIESAEAA